MSDRLKLKYDRATGSEEKADAAKEADVKDEISLYETLGNVRNLCLVLADGKQVFLNYAYLISGEYSSEENLITLLFTTHTVTLKGRVLEWLFEKLLNHEPYKITSTNKRYETIKNKVATIITEIIIQRKDA